jgi:hypothetical protein
LPGDVTVTVSSARGQRKSHPRRISAYAPGKSHLPW